MRYSILALLFSVLLSGCASDLEHQVDNALHSATTGDYQLAFETMHAIEPQSIEDAVQLERAKERLWGQYSGYVQMIAQSDPHRARDNLNAFDDFISTNSGYEEYREKYTALNRELLYR